VINKTPLELPVLGLSPAREALQGAQPVPCRRTVVLVEDDAGRIARRKSPGVDSGEAEIGVRIHLIAGDEREVAAQRLYSPGTLKGQVGRSAVAIELLDSARLGPGAIVTAGPTYGGNRYFRDALAQRGLSSVVELSPSAVVTPTVAGVEWAGSSGRPEVKTLLGYAKWSAVPVLHPRTKHELGCLVAEFGPVLTRSGSGWLFIVQTGKVERLQRGTIFALASAQDLAPAEVTQSISWTRWIRPVVRREERSTLPAWPAAPGAGKFSTRVNIKLARQHDERLSGVAHQRLVDGAPRGKVFSGQQVLNAAELFAGAGGMGLGFILARPEGRRYRISCSAEVHPIYTETLAWNHREYQRRLGDGPPDLVPAQLPPIDLAGAGALEQIRARCAELGDVDVLIGGPPCQGFSNANRNSWHSDNPNNRLVEVYLDFVRTLRPKVFLMENVQGIVWTPRAGAPGAVSVAEGFVQQASEAGYLVFPKALDAVWYGVPQHRHRFFILGIAADFGYTADSFGEWGPFPRPTHGPGTGSDWVTVWDAIGDLPWVGNGCGQDRAAYTCPAGFRRTAFWSAMREGADPDVAWDHVTSKHAGYVLERFRNIPQGENWESIREMFTNYADVSRTHSNIYRRLIEDEPSITIGHYRKSMLVHPRQIRGLSLREAARLQSFPDWFRFMGKTGVEDEEDTGGLTHKQQQLANAVCPLVTKAIAQRIAEL
jgi:site-specific DNA-cytosine methylase